MLSPLAFPIQTRLNVIAGQLKCNGFPLPQAAIEDSNGRCATGRNSARHRCVDERRLCEDALFFCPGGSLQPYGRSQVVDNSALMRARYVASFSANGGRRALVRNGNRSARKKPRLAGGGRIGHAAR